MCKWGNPFSLLVLMTLPVYADLIRGVYFTSLRFLDFMLTRPSRVSLPGDHRRGVPPVPIPNTAVKPSAANGSRTIGPARVGCCQVYGPVLRKKDRASFFPTFDERTPR